MQWFLEVETFGGGTLMNEISALTNETPESSLVSSFMWIHRTSHQTAESVAALVTDFLACRAVRNTFLLTIIYPLHSAFIEQSELRQSLWTQLNFFESFKSSLFLNVQIFCIWLQNSSAPLATLDSIWPTCNCFSYRRGLHEKWHHTVVKSVDL